jgi:ADP-ribose pyrophosphatase
VVYRGRVIRVLQDVVTVKRVRMVRETIQHPGAVVIVPIMDHSRIVLVRQYRHAIGRELLELPAGTLKPGERPATCAKRELAEETGWSARRWRRIGGFFAAPGYTDEWLTIFLAMGLSATTAQPDVDEDVCPVPMSFRSALAKIRSGDICDAKSIIGVLLARGFLGRLVPR